MLRLIAFLLLVAGLAVAAHPWLPEQWQQPWLIRLLPASPLMIGGGAAVLGALVLVATRRRTSGEAVDDAGVRSVLLKRGLRFIELGSGWQAEGGWSGVDVVVGRRHDYHATRFGRPWVLVVRLPGAPIEPWPFMPDQALIADHHQGGFSVVIADVCTPGGHTRLAERLDRLVASRRG